MVTARDVHLNAFEGWQVSRGERRFPALGDLDFERATNSPYLTTVDLLPDGQFRYVRVGSQVIADFGRNPAGTIVGSHVFPSRFAVEICSAYMMVCAVRTPMFTFGQYVRPDGAVQEVSRLLLPLGATDRRAETVLVSRVARYSNVIGGQEIDWLGSSAGQLDHAVAVHSATQLCDLATRWDARDCAALRCVRSSEQSVETAAV